MKEDCWPEIKKKKKRELGISNNKIGKKR